MIRQGDILFIPVTEIPNNDPQRKIRKSGIIAQGEATGHHHRIAEADMAVAEIVEVGHTWDGRFDTYLSVTDHGISIVHEEHKTVTLPVGSYKIHQAREFDYMSQFSRTVRD